MDLVRTNDLDTGSIENSTFQGGSIEVYGGPWTIKGNTVKGAFPETYSAAAFALDSPHDVTLADNQVTQSDAGGREFRLVVMAVSGYDNVIEGNTFGGGSGRDRKRVGLFFRHRSVLRHQRSGSDHGREQLRRPVRGKGSAPFLPTAGFLFCRTSVHGQRPDRPGLAWSSRFWNRSARTVPPEPGPTGEWFPVALQVSLSSANTIELLMADPLPALPQDGYYVVEVTGGFVDNSIINNQLNLAGKSSTGVVLNGADYGTTITGNVFVGGSTSSQFETPSAIALTATIGSAASGVGTFPLPSGWTALPNLGTVVENNTIQDFLGGIVLGTLHWLNYWEVQVGTNSETGRVFLTATVSDNVFTFDSAFLSWWSGASPSFGNNPAQPSTPPPVTIGSGWSIEAPGPYGSPRFPWTLGATVTVNGARFADLCRSSRKRNHPAGKRGGTHCGRRRRNDDHRRNQPGVRGHCQRHRHGALDSPADIPG